MTAALNRHPQLNKLSLNNLIRHSTKPVTVADVSLPCLTLTSGTAHNTDKNRMELVAIANALSTIKEESSIFILSDSQFVVNGFNRGWIANWKSNGWVRGKNQKVFNIDVLDYILNASKKHSISFRWLQDFSMVNESRRAEELIQYRKN